MGYESNQLFDEFWYYVLSLSSIDFPAWNFQYLDFINILIVTALFFSAIFLKWGKRNFLRLLAKLHDSGKLHHF